MVTRKAAVFVGVLVLVLFGAAAVSYACATCGCSGPPPKPEEAKQAVTPPFTVLDVTGPAKGKNLCYICRYGGRPSFVVFTRRTDGHVQHLAKTIDKFVADNKKANVRAFVVLLGENNTANKAKLTALAKEHKLNIPLTIAATGTTEGMLFLVET